MTGKRKLDSFRCFVPPPPPTVLAHETVSIACRFFLFFGTGKISYNTHAINFVLVLDAFADKFFFLKKTSKTPGVYTFL